MLRGQNIADQISLYALGVWRFFVNSWAPSSVCVAKLHIYILLSTCLFWEQSLCALYFNNQSCFVSAECLAHINPKPLLHSHPSSIVINSLLFLEWARASSSLVFAFMVLLLCWCFSKLYTMVKGSNVACSVRAAVLCVLREALLLCFY